MAASYTITPTPVQQAGLLAALAAANAAIAEDNIQRAAQKPPEDPLPLLTAQDYVSQRAADVLNSYASQHRDAILGEAIANYPNLTTQQRQQVCTAVGLPDVASLPLPAQIQVLGGLGTAIFLEMTPDQQNQLFTLLGIGV